MINYEYISSTPLFRLLEEHPLAGSYLENLRLADLPEELPLLAGLTLTEPAALKEFELTAVQVADELAAWLCVMEKAGAAGGDDQIKLFFIGAGGQLGPDGGNIIRHDGGMDDRIAGFFQHRANGGAAGIGALPHARAVADGDHCCGICQFGFSCSVDLFFMIPCGGGGVKRGERQNKSRKKSSAAAFGKAAPISFPTMPR